MHYTNNFVFCKFFPIFKSTVSGLEENFRQELMDHHGLECVKADLTLADHKMFVVSNRKTFGLTESEILSSVHRGVKEMINLENRFAASSLKSITTTLSESEECKQIADS